MTSAPPNPISARNCCSLQLGDTVSFEKITVQGLDLTHPSYMRVTAAAATLKRALASRTSFCSAGMTGCPGSVVVLAGEKHPLLAMGPESAQ